MLITRVPGSNPKLGELECKRGLSCNEEYHNHSWRRVFSNSLVVASPSDSRDELCSTATKAGQESPVGSSSSTRPVVFCLLSGTIGKSLQFDFKESSFPTVELSLNGSTKVAEQSPPPPPPPPVGRRKGRGRFEERSFMWQWTSNGMLWSCIRSLRCLDDDRRFAHHASQWLYRIFLPSRDDWVIVTIAMVR